MYCYVNGLQIIYINANLILEYLLRFLFSILNALSKIELIPFIWNVFNFEYFLQYGRIYYLLTKNASKLCL